MKFKQIQKDVLFVSNNKSGLDHEGPRVVCRRRVSVNRSSAGKSLLSGTPVVAHDVEGTRKSLVTGKRGFLFPIGDAHGMAEAVTMLLKDTDRAAALGQEARRATLDKMDRTRLMQHERSEYEKVLRWGQT